MGKKEAGQIIKFFGQINEIFDIIDFKQLGVSNIPSEVEKLAKERDKLRKSGDFQKSDELRMEIEKYGFLVEDSKEGFVLKKLQRRG